MTNATRATQAKSQQAEADRSPVAKVPTTESSLTDTRPEASAQRQRITMTNNSPRALRQSALQDSVDNSAHMVAQRAQMAILFGGKALKSGSEAPIQRVLDPVTRRVKADESDWKKVLAGNAFTATDIKKIEDGAGHGDELAADYVALKDIDYELDGFGGSALGASAIKKRKDRIKDRLEGVYTHITDKARAWVDDANTHYSTQANLGADAVRNFKARTDRTRPNGNAYAAGQPLLQHEKDGPVKALIDACYVGIGWQTAVAFKTEVMRRFTDGNMPLPALGAVAAARLATEKTAINTQLTAWATVAFPYPPGAPNGTNADGTWGTSAGGAGVGGALPVSTVSPAVWAELRKWWSKKAGAFVTTSLTTTWSLKMDRNPDVDGLSPRINYHINVA